MLVGESQPLGNWEGKAKGAKTPSLQGVSQKTCIIAAFLLLLIKTVAFFVFLQRGSEFSQEHSCGNFFKNCYGFFCFFGLKIYMILGGRFMKALRANQAMAWITAVFMLLMLAPAVSMAKGQPDITVYVGIYDYTAVTYGADNASEKGIILDLTEVVVPNGAATLDAAKLAMDDNNIPYETDTQYDFEYIISINNLSVSDCGPESGWLISINDDFEKWGALSAGDVVKLHYSVVGFGTDVGSYYMSKPKVTKLTLKDSSGNALAHYIENESGASILGEGTKPSPYIIAVQLDECTDVTALTAEVESTLHPDYLFFEAEDGLVDISKPTSYENDVAFCIQTMGGHKKTYYTIRITNEETQEDEGEEDENTGQAPLPDYTGDWTSFRGSEENMGITMAKTPKTTGDAYLKWAAKYSGDVFEVITPPIIVNDTLYIAKGRKVLKIDPKDGKILAQSGDLANSIGYYGMIPVTYGQGMIFVPLDGGRVQALRADTLESLWVSESLGGQTISPITYKNGYIYTGTWTSDKGKGTYFCLSVQDEDVTKTDEIKRCTWKIEKEGGFYLAGALATDDYVIFGSDDGETGSARESAVLFSVHPITGEVIDTIEGIKGDIRSSVSYDGETDRIYFATKGGMFYQVKVQSDGTFDKNESKSLNLGGMCTSTPLVYDGLAYLGVSGESDNNTYKIIDVLANPMKEVGFVQVPGYAQASALLSTAYSDEANKVYIYTTYNSAPGGIYVIEVEKTGEFDQDGGAVVNALADHLFIPESDKANFCTCSLISDKSGVIYYKNDSEYLMAIAPKAISERAILEFKIGNSKGVINEAKKTITVTVEQSANLKALAPEITVSENATVTPASGEVVDFTNPVTYTVVAKDVSTQEYVVTVTKQSGTGGGGGGSAGSSDITVCVTMEKFTLGQGYIIEPILVKVKKHTPVSEVITDLLKKKYPGVSQPCKNEGTIESGFYLSYVYDTDTDINIPGFILDAFGGNLGARASSSYLGEFDYSPWSGWIYSVNGDFVDTGASDWKLENKQVVRWQFTLDKNDNALYPTGQSPDVSLANKEALTWRVAQINAMSNKASVLATGNNREKYDNAMAVLVKIDSTQAEVDKALSELSKLSSSSGGVGGGAANPADDEKTIPTTLANGDNTAFENDIFEDIEDVPWAKEYIYYLAEKGIIKGKTQTSFAPGDHVTRAEFVTILWRISNDETAEEVAVFDDVGESDWFAKSVAWAAGAGITKGVSDRTFAPSDNISRQDVACMLLRFAGHMDFELPALNEEIVFSDGGDIAEYAKEPVSAMQRAGIISGKGNDVFAPLDFATRAECSKMITMLLRLMED